LAPPWRERRWVLEDCRHLTRRLESDLLRVGEAIVRVPPKVLAAEHRGTRSPCKSDPVHADAVPRAALRDDDVPVARLEGETRRVKLLIDHREDLVAEGTRMQARVRWHRHELMPELDQAPKAFNRFRHFDRGAAELANTDSIVGVIAAELVERIRDLTVRCNQLERETTAIVKRFAPTLLDLAAAVPSAAKIVDETVGIDRFKSKPRSPAGTAQPRSRCEPAANDYPSRNAWQPQFGND
jgi:transposase